MLESLPSPNIVIKLVNHNHEGFCRTVVIVNDNQIINHIIFQGFHLQEQIMPGYLNIITIQ